MKHYVKRGTRYYFNYRVPKKYQKLHGKAQIQFSLKTDSESTARRLSGAHFAKIKDIESAHDIDPDQTRLHDLINKISNDYKTIKTEEDYIAFNSHYDANYESNHNSDELKAAAIVLARNPKQREALGYSRESYFDTALNKFCDHSDKSSGYTSKVKRTVKCFNEFTSQRILFSDVDRVLVTKFIDHISALYSQKVMSDMLSHLNSLWKYSLNRGYTKNSSPFTDHDVVSRKQTKQIPYQSFSLPDLNLLLPELNNKAKDLSYAWFFPIALMTGLRKEELFGLRIIDIVTVGDNYFIDINDKHRSLKNANATRLVPIHSSILPAILSLKDCSNNDNLFPSAFKPKLASSSYYRWFAQIKKALGFTKTKSLHSCRHSLSQVLHKLEIDDHSIASILGHDKASFASKRYAQVTFHEKLISAINKVGEEMKPIIKLFPPLN